MRDRLDSGGAVDEIRSVIRSIVPTNLARLRLLAAVALLSAASAFAQSETVGIVMSAKPGVVVKGADGSFAPAVPGMELDRRSVLALDGKTKAGIVQVYMASDGLVAFTRFPVVFSAASVKAIPRNLADRILAGIGGSPLTSGSSAGGLGYGSSSASGLAGIGSGSLGLAGSDSTGGGFSKSYEPELDAELEAPETSALDSLVDDAPIEWFIATRSETFEPPEGCGYLGGIPLPELAGGFTLTFGPGPSSRDSGRAAPLRYRFLKDYKASAVTAELYDYSFEPVGEPKRLSAKGDDWTFAFKDFRYDIPQPYYLRFVFESADGSKSAWTTAFTPWADEELAYVESEIREAISGDLSAFERDMLRASIYLKYDLKLSQLRTLEAAGISLEGHL